MKVFWYLRSWRVIIGIIILLVAIFDSGEGKVFTSAWDGSIQYKKPIDSDTRITMYGMGFIAIGFGLYGRYKKRNKTESETKN